MSLIELGSKGEREVRGLGPKGDRRLPQSTLELRHAVPWQPPSPGPLLEPLPGQDLA